MVLSPGARGKASFQVLSRRPPTSGDNPAWTRHLTGAIDVSGVRRSSSNAPAAVADLRARLMHEAKGGQLVEQLWRSNGEALARVSSSANDSRGESPLSPALLAVCFDVLASAQSEDDAAGRGA